MTHEQALPTNPATQELIERAASRNEVETQTVIMTDHRVNTVGQFAGQAATAPNSVGYFSNFKRSAKTVGAIAAGSLAFNVGTAVAAESASASPVPPVMNAAELPASVTASFRTESNSSAKASAADVATGTAKVRVNVGTKMTAKKVRRLTAQGRCFMVGKGSRYPVIQTQGYNGSGNDYTRDTRPSKVCKGDDGVYRRTLCKNRVKFRIPKVVTPRQFVFWVKKNATLNLEAKSYAEAQCVSGGASARATASASASVRVRARDYLRTVSQGYKNAAVQMYNNISGRAATTAVAEAKCSDTSAVIVSIDQRPPVTIPAKDGTQTPAPPAPAPGPNPAPSPQEPVPGGYQCYNETTGQPVQPRPGGTCPAGSYGGPAV